MNMTRFSLCPESYHSPTLQSVIMSKYIHHSKNMHIVIYCVTPCTSHKPPSSGVKYLSKNNLKYYLSSFLGVSTLYYLYFFILLLLLHYIPKEKNALFTPYIFPDTQKYSFNFECLEGQNF